MIDFDPVQGFLLYLAETFLSTVLYPLSKHSGYASSENFTWSGVRLFLSHETS